MLLHTIRHGVRGPIWLIEFSPTNASFPVLRGSIFEKVTPVIVNTFLSLTILVYVILLVSHHSLTSVRRRFSIRPRNVSRPLRKQTLRSSRVIGSQVDSGQLQIPCHDTVQSDTATAVGRDASLLKVLDVLFDSRTCGVDSLLADSGSQGLGQVNTLATGQNLVHESAQPMGVMCQGIDRCRSAWLVAISSRVLTSWPLMLSVHCQQTVRAEFSRGRGGSRAHTRNRTSW